MALNRVIDSGGDLEIHTDQNADGILYDKTNLTVELIDWNIIIKENGGVIFEKPFYEISDPQSNSGREALDTIEGYLNTVILPTAAQIKTLYESNPDTNEFSDSEKSQLAALGTPVREVFTPTLGQTVFTLLNSDVATTRTLVEVNGQLQHEGNDYTLSGTTLTWLDNDFTLDTTDQLIVYYSK